MMKMREIIPHVFLGNKKDAHNFDDILNSRISRIINCSTNIPFNDEINSNEISLFRVPVEDSNNEKNVVNFLKLLPLCVDKINRSVNRSENVLIHCKLGRQRSSTVIAAYLIYKKDMSPSDAIDFIRKKDSNAFFWKPVFYGLLLKWEQILDHKKKI